MVDVVFVRRRLWASRFSSTLLECVESCLLHYLGLSACIITLIVSVYNDYKIISISHPNRTIDHSTSTSHRWLSPLKSESSKNSLLLFY